MAESIPEQHSVPGTPEFVLSSGPSGPPQSSARNGSSELSNGQPQRQQSDVFEEIDDLSEFLAKPFQPLPLIERPDAPTEQTRNKPKVLSSSPSTSSGQPLAKPHHTLPSHHLPQSQASGGRPPPSLSDASGSNGMIISGNGARVPTQFLDATGSFPREQNGQHMQTLIPSSGSNVNSHASGSRPTNGASSSQSAGPSGGKDGRLAISAIDLTGDDEDSDDEPILVSSRPAAASDVVIDETRSNAIVCLGLINSVVLCMYGLPSSLTFAGDYNAEPPSDPAYERANWSMSTSFWSEKGYRPVLLNTNNVASPPAPTRTLPGGWTHTAPTGKSSDIKVSVILPPMVARPNLTPEQARTMQPAIMAPFGSLAEKYITAMEPLLRTNRIRCEARCRMVSAGRSNNFLHSIEILVFARRPDVALVSERLSSQGIQLDHPTAYHPEDYPTHPEYSNPHNPLAGGYRADQLRTGYSGLYRGSTMGTVIQSRDAAEKQKEQVDTIYSSIRSGEELNQVEPNELITSKLFPYQKQALGFLLDRERKRSWSELHGNREDNVNGKEKANKKEEDFISLWTVKKGSDGKIRSWTHLITQREATKKPNICRGAILADDMGLGKTITTISLIAHTQEEAKAFGESALASYSPLDSDGEGTTLADQRKRSSSNPNVEEVTADDFSLTIYGAPPPAKKPKRKVSKSKKDPETVRQAHLERRSRATLIICPLSIVSNWEEQIKEHWDRDEPPSIYIYHGGSRLTSTAALSNFDIVITTYPTLGHEFSNQNIWTAEEPGAKLKAQAQAQQQDSDDDEDAVVAVNENGIPVIENGKGKKRKKRSNGKMAPNALQRIEWFRIVLDEAHSIKGAGTWQSKAVCNLSAQRRLCLTGTPIQNGIDDMFALLKFLRLEPFTDRAIWNEFCGHKEHNSGLRARKSKGDQDPIDGINLGHVQIIMKHIALRRSKDTKLVDGKPILSLPPKYSKTEFLEFEEAEKARYTALHNRYKEEFDDMMQGDVTSNYATILHEILNLRLACDHPSLVDASKDAKRKLGGSGDSLTAAINQDGLSRERATALFEIYRDSGVAYCTECSVDLTKAVEQDGDTELRTGRLEELDDALHAAAANGNSRAIKPLKKKSSTSTPVGPQSPDESSAATPTFVRPVITKCQHIFCSSCFGRSIGDAWPKPKFSDVGSCPSCRVNLKLVLDAIQLEPTDFPEEEEDSDHGDDPFEDDEEEDKKPSMFEDEEEQPSKKRKTAVTQDDAMLLRRTDLSTKVRALISDLIPFSKCNPASALYDPTAPLLEHVDPSTSSDAEVSQSTEPVVVIQKSPFDNKTPYDPVKSVVFSQWTKMLDRIQKSLKLTGIRYTRLDGGMKRIDRSAAIEKFKQDPGCEVFLVSLRAGGTGLNLVQANRAYLMDPYWNPAVENQGLDRVHRMGQYRPVITVKYIMKNSIEENMLELQKRKMQLADKVGSCRQVQTSAEKAEERREELKLLFR